MTTRESTSPEDIDAPPPAAGEAIPTIIGHRVDPAPDAAEAAPVPDAESTQKVPRPPPLKSQPRGWRRNALAGAVLLGLSAGAILVLAPPRGLPGWLLKIGGRAPTDQAGRSEPVPGTGGSPLPETRSMVPAPTPPMPEVAAEGETPPPDEVLEVEAAEPAPAVAKPKAPTASKAKKTDRRRASRARSRLPDDSTVEVEFF
jgi:hypothetical protein